jgi:hypothetical protein
MFFIGFASVANGLIALQIKRMSVSPVFAYAYIASLVVGGIPGCLMPAFAFVAGAFRPDRDPQIMVMLYDWCLLSFVGSLGCFCTQNMVLALAIFLDKNDILPKWLAYMSIWMIVTELLAGPIFIFNAGPLAWNGSISFYLGTAVFVLWEICIIRLLYVAIKKQSPAEQTQGASAPSRQQGHVGLRPRRLRDLRLLLRHLHDLPQPGTRPVPGIAAAPEPQRRCPQHAGAARQLMVCGTKRPTDTSG